MSWFTVGGNAGIALGPVVVTPVLLATRLHGTPLLAVPAVIMGAVLAVRRPWRAPEIRAREAGRRRAVAGHTDNWRGFVQLTAVVVLRSVAYFGVASLVALFAIRHFHEPTAVGSAALALFIGAGVIGTLSGGWLADRWHRMGVLRLGYGLSALIAALLALVPDIVLLLLAVFALGIALFAPFAVQVTLGQDFLPNRLGMASGVTLGLAVSVGGLTTPLFGLLADRYGLTTALAAASVFPALACVLSMLVRDPRV
jgi:FSR family fosmidomycin resistance protein-like MFS transporter